MALISPRFYKEINLTYFMSPFSMDPARSRRINSKDFIFIGCFDAGEV
jgi:hypothetical protein